MDNRTTLPRQGGIKSVLFLFAVAVALGIGLALSITAYGAGLEQQANTGGDMTGVATVNGHGVAGITVELRQRSNAGADTSLATTNTDDSGVYHFPGKPSAPSDAFYYIRFSGGKGTLAMWYTFPIIYVSGSDFNVPAVELGDVALVEPQQGATLKLPGTIQWSSRKSGETYRLFIYAAGKTDKPVLDSGTLGATTEYSVPEGGLPEGSYEAIVQVRDTVAGYGQSQAHFRFTVGSGTSASQGSESSAPQIQPTAETAGDGTGGSQGSSGTGTESGVPAANPTAPVQIPSGSGDSEQAVDLKVRLSGDKTSVAPGESITYKIEVSNAGQGLASNVIITDKLPAGVTVNPSGATSSVGTVTVDGNVVTVQVSEITPNGRVVVEIPVTVGKEAGANVSNQATAKEKSSTDTIQSNAYIAQVEAPQAQPEQAFTPTPVAAAEQSAPPSQPEQATAEPAQQQTGTGGSGETGGAAPTAASAPTAAAAPAVPRAGDQQTAGGGEKQVPKAQPQSKAEEKTQTSPAKTQQQKPAESMPHTGGSFPVFFALALVLITLLARYLRGRRYRRV